MIWLNTKISILSFGHLSNQELVKGLRNVIIKEYLFIKLNMCTLKHII